MGEARCRDAWARTSAVLAMIANVNRDPKRTRVFKPSDFDPFEAAKGGKADFRTRDLSILRRVFVKGGGQA